MLTGGVEQCGLVFIVQVAVQRGIHGVLLRNDDVAVKSSPPAVVTQGHDTLADGQEFQVGEIAQGPVSDGDHAVGDGQLGQGVTAGEDFLSDGGHGVGYGDLGQSLAVLKGIVADVGDPVFDDHGGHTVVFPRCSASVGIVAHLAVAGDGQQTVLQHPRAVAGGAGEDVRLGGVVEVPRGFDQRIVVFAERDAGQILFGAGVVDVFELVAVGESPLTHKGETAGQDDVGQLFTGAEGAVLDGSHALGDGDRGDFGAPVEGVFRHHRGTLGDDVVARKGGGGVDEIVVEIQHAVHPVGIVVIVSGVPDGLKSDVGQMVG